MKKIHLNIDMDGVLCKWAEAVTEELGELCPNLKLVPPDQIRFFDLRKCYPPEAEAAVIQACGTPRLYISLAPMEGAIAALKDMETNCQDFLEPFILSSPNTRPADGRGWSEKAEWVYDHLGRWWVDRMILTRDKTAVRGDFLIDDKPLITGAFEPEWTQLMYSQPWNESERKSGMAAEFNWTMWPSLKDALRGASKLATEMAEDVTKSSIILV